jgi:hypothetical protein
VIIAFAILCTSAFGTVSMSLIFANAIHKRALADENCPTKASVAEKRRVLERARSSYFMNGKAVGAASVEVDKIERELLALADEEARCLD